MFLIYWHKNFRVSPPNTTSQKDQARPGYPHFLPCIHWQLAAAVVLSHGLVLALLVLDPQIRILNDAEHFRFQIPEVESTFFYIWVLVRPTKPCPTHKQPGSVGDLFPSLTAVLRFSFQWWREGAHHLYLPLPCFGAQKPVSFVGVC